MQKSVENKWLFIYDLRILFREEVLTTGGMTPMGETDWALTVRRLLILVVIRAGMFQTQPRLVERRPAPLESKPMRFSRHNSETVSVSIKHRTANSRQAFVKLRYLDL
jgi:hypothetical protein